MKTSTVLIAAGALALASVTTFAQDRGSRDGRSGTWRGGDGTRDRGDWRQGDGRTSRGDWDRSRGGDWDRHRGGDWHRGHRGDWHGHRHHHGWAPRYYPRFYSYPRYYSFPHWWYWPTYVPRYYPYSYPIYEPPVVIERYYEPVEPLPPPPRAYSERSQAQITPPAPRPAPPPPARLERQTLSAKELFDFDKATLRMPQPRLDEIAEVMKRNPQITNVRITGYTDRLGSDAYNMKLSQRRADAVKNYLAGKGVEATRLVAEGRGETNPVVQCNQTKQAELIKCLEPNRRVEVEQITVERRVP